MTAIHPEQQALLEGATFTWTAYNNTTLNSSSGTEVISNGFKQFIVTFSEPGTLFINLTNPSWIDTGTNSLEVPLVLYGTDVEENNTEENETETPWSPEVMLDVTLDCGTVVIDPSIYQDLECAIFNPNNYTIDVSLEADGWSQWDTFILFEPTAGQSEFSLDDSETKKIEIRVDILQNLSENGLTSGMIQIDLRQGPSDYTSPGDKPLTFDIQWTLKEDDPVVTPPTGDNNTNQTKIATEDSSSGNTMLIAGGVIGVAVIGLVVFIVLRIRNSDLEDWEEDDLDFEPEVEESGRVSKPLPVGVALDEFEDKTIVDDSPDRPDVIADFDEEDAYEEYEEEQYEEETDSENEESSDEDSGITVDEHGTEWYEDEIGVWWFRDPGEEDWSEYVE